MTKAEIQLIKSLADKRARDEQGLFIAEGEKLIAEIAASGLTIRKLYTLEKSLQRMEREIVSPKEMERISQLKSASSALAIVEIPQHNLDIASLKGKLTLVLDGVQNPGNLGTIIRLADWYGIEDIVCSPTSADSYNPKVVQASMGAIIRVRVHYTPLPPFLESAQKHGLAIYGTALDGENLYKAELQNEALIIMGNEGRGLSPEVIEMVDRKLFIPPYPADRMGSESLNVAIATAVICAEFRRAKK
ncbi:MAG: RNA methyltransferase [Rikenellaceae bacterium]